MLTSTVMWTVDPSHPAREVLAQAATHILRGELVAFPTETVYGLGANAFDTLAVHRIFAAKGRPFDDPLIVHVAGVEDIAAIATAFPPEAQRLADEFWPGPLTLLLPRHAALPPDVTAGLDTVAVRVPRHPVALGLIRASGVPIAAPSANRFGHTSPTAADHVLADLDGLVDVILDAGSTPVGIESTVLDLQTTPATILRPGGTTREQIEGVIGPVRYAPASERPAASPGRQPRHYAPHAQVVLVEGATPEQIADAMAREARSRLAAGQSVGILAASDVCALVDAGQATCFDLGPLDDLLGIARRLFLGMRNLEARPVEVILSHRMPSGGLGLALNDRLSRAARSSA